MDKSIHLTHFEPIFQFSTIVFSLIFYANVPIFYPLISVCYQKNENDFRILSELSACLNSTFKVKKDILFQVNGAQHYSNFLKKLNIKSLKPKKNKIETIKVSNRILVRCKKNFNLDRQLELPLHT